MNMMTKIADPQFGVDEQPSSDLQPRQRNFKIVVAYDGTDFVGWQRQSLPNANNRSVQGEIERGLKKCLREVISLQGAGRTDSGVHSLGQAASFLTSTKMPVSKLTYALNGVLPADVRILSCEEVPLAFHARYDAVGKTYVYYFVCGAKPTAFNWRQVYFCKYHLDLAKMAAAATVFEGNHNFKSFTAKGNPVRTYERQIYRCVFREEQGEMPYQGLGQVYALEVTGGGFMYKMVRLLMGAILAVGIGRLEISDLAAALAKPGKIIAPPAPACGLYLKEVYYDEKGLRDLLV